MIDLAFIDEIYERGKASGLGPPQWRLFDKRVLLPLSWLPDAVKKETNEVIAEDTLRAKAAEGWFVLLSGAGDEGNEQGVPLYVPSRIGLFLKLEREGYAADELRAIAEQEDWNVENVFTTDELAYVDDDLEALIQYLQNRTQDNEGEGITMSPGLEARKKKEIEKARRELGALESYRMNGVPDDMRPEVEKAAYRARALHESVRLMLLKMDRDAIEAGFSPSVLCTRRWNFSEGFKGTEIRWRLTMSAAIASARPDEAPRIRVPGFLLCGDQITPTRTLRPTDYAALWGEYDFDEYLKVWSATSGERVCLNCFAPLTSANERKRFCGEKCRNAARQRRYRERNPEAVERTQKRYWESIELEGD